MRVPISDQMLTSGHALFENGQIRDGYILHLDQHLDRLFGGIAKIRLTEQMKQVEWGTKEKLREIITETVSRSGVRDGAFRYYLSGGMEGGETPNFYAIVEDGIPVKPINGCKDL
jgi:branched-subunit amino acid aminotransferase/4-amino-4-deoxychorismate lyase